MGKIRVLLQPLGFIDEDILGYLRKGIEHVLKGLIVDINNRIIGIGSEFMNEKRGQYNSDLIIKFLAANLVGHGYHRVLGVLDADAYSGSLNFVFGEAYLNGPVAVIYLARLRPEFYGEPSDEELFLERVLKEAIHELGHTFGLRHCPFRKCVMSFSNSIWDTDYKSYMPCGRCASRLMVYGIRALHL